MKIILDSNVLIALTNQNDSLHAAASEAVAGLQNDQVLLPAIVVTEVLILDQQPLLLLESFRKNWPDILATTEEEMLAVAEFPFEMRKKLKTNDCLILAHCIIHEARLVTFDQNLKQAYEEVCLS